MLDVKSHISLSRLAQDSGVLALVLSYNIQHSTVACVDRRVETSEVVGAPLASLSRLLDGRRLSMSLDTRLRLTTQTLLFNFDMSYFLELRRRAQGSAPRRLTPRLI